MLVRVVTAQTRRVHGDRWTVCLGISVDVRCPLGAWLGARRFALFAEAAKRALTALLGMSGGKVARAIYIVALLSMFEITHVIFSSSDLPITSSPAAVRAGGLWLPL
jgi:hypothetical protein